MASILWFICICQSFRLNEKSALLPSWRAILIARVNFKRLLRQYKKKKRVHIVVYKITAQMHEVMLSTPSIQFDLVYDRQICISGNPKVSVGLHLNWCIGVTTSNVHMPIGCIKSNNLLRSYFNWINSIECIISLILCSDSNMNWKYCFHIYYDVAFSIVSVASKLIRIIPSVFFSHIKYSHVSHQLMH